MLGQSECYRSEALWKTLQMLFSCETPWWKYAELRRRSLPTPAQPFSCVCCSSATELLMWNWHEPIPCLSASTSLPFKNTFISSKRPLWPTCKNTGNLATWGTGRESTFGSPVGRQAGMGPGWSNISSHPSKNGYHSTYTSACREAAGRPCRPAHSAVETHGHRLSHSGSEGLISLTPHRSTLLLRMCLTAGP